MTGRGSDQFPLRLPDGMRDEIKAAAEANNRTMNAEIVARLSGQQPTLRDEFAMAALGCIADHFSLNKGVEFAKASQHVVAALCYDYADAMLAAREAQP